MKKFYLIIFIIIAVLVAGGIYYAIKTRKPSGEISPMPLVSQDTVTRKEIIIDVSKKIAEISPVKPVLGGKWYVTRFWFIKDSNKEFYIEYEDGHIMSQILVEANRTNESLNYKIVGVFEPGETSWILKQGEDKFFGSLLDLYEYNEELGEWVKKN